MTWRATDIPRRSHLRKHHSLRVTMLATGARPPCAGAEALANTRMSMRPEASFAAAPAFTALPGQIIYNPFRLHRAPWGRMGCAQLAQSN
jgi:hypothetical protein